MKNFQRNGATSNTQVGKDFALFDYIDAQIIGTPTFLKKARMPYMPNEIFPRLMCPAIHRNLFSFQKFYPFSVSNSLFV
jgi:hypothetical protein